MSLIADRLAAVRSLMSERGYDALVIPRADEYLGEYLPEHNERMLWMAGFTGSAGAIVVLAERAAIFVDGRYTVQVRREVSGELFEYCRLGEDSLADWLSANEDKGTVVACPGVFDVFDVVMKTEFWAAAACFRTDSERRHA